MYIKPFILCVKKLKSQKVLYDVPAIKTITELYFIHYYWLVTNFEIYHIGRFEILICNHYDNFNTHCVKYNQVLKY